MERQGADLPARQLRLSPAVLLAAAAFAAAGCGGGHDPGTRARAAVQGYLDAIARGDGEAACRRMSQTTIKEAEFRSFAQCADSYSHIQKAGRYPIVSVRVTSPARAEVEIGDAEISDSGNETLVVRDHAGRWLIDPR